LIRNFSLRFCPFGRGVKKRAYARLGISRFNIRTDRFLRKFRMGARSPFIFWRTPSFRRRLSSALHFFCGILPDPAARSTVWVNLFGGFPFRKIFIGPDPSFPLFPFGNIHEAHPSFPPVASGKVGAAIRIRRLTPLPRRKRQSLRRLLSSGRKVHKHTVLLCPGRQRHGLSFSLPTRNAHPSIARRSNGPALPENGS